MTTARKHKNAPFGIDTPHDSPRPVGSNCLPPRTAAIQRSLALPGKVDWAHFSHANTGRERAPLMAFMMMLAYSRQIYLRFFLETRMENFLRGQIGTFNAWGGVPGALRGDRSYTGRPKRITLALHFQQAILSFATHYHFEPRLVAVGPSDETMLMESAARYIHETFFLTCSYTNLDDLNAQAAECCRTVAPDRPFPAGSVTSGT